MSEYLFWCEISLKLNANLILPAVVIINEAVAGQPVWAGANLVPRFFSPLSPRWETLKTRLDWGDRAILYYLWWYELHNLYCVRQQKEQKGYFFCLVCLFVFYLMNYTHTVCFKFCIDGSLVSILGNLENVWLLWKAVEILLFRSDALPVIWYCKGCANFKETSNESFHNTPTRVSSYGVFLDAVHPRCPSLRVSVMTHDSFELCTIKPFVPLLMCTGSYSLETLGSTRDLFINICSGIERRWNGIEMQVLPLVMQINSSRCSFHFTIREPR